MKSFSKYILPTLIALSALSVSASAAFYSVFGLSKLFAGATYEVIIMATSLEVSKLVIATLLHNYWKTLNKLLRLYLTVAVVVLIVITSMGIYGFLSAAYQQTASQQSALTKQIEFIEQKEEFYIQDLNRYDSELVRISETINSLSNARSREIQVRDTSVVGGIRNTISTTELRLAQERIAAEEQNRTLVQEKRTVAADSVQKFQLLKLELQSNNELAAELGPLIYLSGLTGISMDRIINILLLVIIFVFDPLAVSLVLAANTAFKHASRKDESVDKTELHERTRVDEERTNDKLSSFSYPDDENDDKTDEELWENTLEDGLDDEDWEVIDDEPTQDPDDDSELVSDETFNEEYTGEKPVKVEKILQKTPSKRHVLLSNGKRLILDKNQIDDNDLTIKYF